MFYFYLLYLQNESSVAQSLDSSLQRQLSFDLSSISSPTDLITTIQLFNVDLMEFARENVGLFLTVQTVVQHIWKQDTCSNEHGVCPMPL